MADYLALREKIAAFIPALRLITDPLRTLAYGTDASFYRLVPQIIVKVESESEVQRLLALSREFRAPLTFRAAGTSLSGQAVTDSILVLLGDNWQKAEVLDNGQKIRLGPGVVGAQANAFLKPYGRKIGPDPASIDAAKIGGIAANNASGMCCGTTDNSYKTLAGMRLILADGTILDSENLGDSWVICKELLSKLEGVSLRVKGNPELTARISRKFAIKNTTGYSLNALIDFTDPWDILSHLIIGSEGTLGFISSITYNTVIEHPCKASALLIFGHIKEACEAVIRLKPEPVSAVELMDRAALASVAHKPGMPQELADLPDNAAALLVETRAETKEELKQQISHIEKALQDLPPLFPVAFTADPYEFAKLWKIRKGLFPAVGAVRPVGTTVIIEDVAFRIQDLANATLDLQHLFLKHGYREAIIFGHALDGNLHFVFTQDFSIPEEVTRYADFMADVCHLVVDKYDGSLKAEHGTGRNMAPFVELEWGQDAYRLMREIKDLFDPLGILNPGVILNDNPHAHLENLKPMPGAHRLVDACIECGFCEPQCPSHGFTLSPRQRIVVWREISSTKKWWKDFQYKGLETCAACGLCGNACPVGVEVGLLTKFLRGQEQGSLSKGLAKLAGKNFGPALKAARLGLKIAQPLGILPRAGCLDLPTTSPGDVVYIPSCGNRLMEDLPQVIMRLLNKAGFKVIIPDNMDNLCCGLAFASKGFSTTAAEKAEEMKTALLKASNNGELPIIMDAASCSYHLKSYLEIQDITEFLHDQVLPRLKIRQQPGPVILHVNCGLKKIGGEEKLIALAQACAEKVIIPKGINCCGFAGDKGFTTPELNAYALRGLKSQIPNDCKEAYSANITCEIGLSKHSGIEYKHIAYLLDKTLIPIP